MEEAEEVEDDTGLEKSRLNLQINFCISLKIVGHQGLSLVYLIL